VAIKVIFYSYFKDLAGCVQTAQEVPPGSTVQDLIRALAARFPRLAAMDRAMLVAVGVDYQARDYVLKPGDEVSLFPPVQGG
jgi:molybdopterin converting factor small subunit